MSYESHDCKEEKIWCAFCDQLLTPEEYANHDCSGDGDGDDPDGGDPSGGGGAGGGETGIGSYHPDNNGTTTIGNPPYLPQEIHATVEGEILFKEN